RIQYDCRQCTLTTEDKWKIQKVAEYETAFFADVFGSRRRQTIRIRYYGDEKLFMKAQRRAVGRVISETGLYSPTSKQILVFKWSRFLATSYHECVHAIYHHHANIRPTWINEGMAEYFKGAVIDSAGNITIQEVPSRKTAMKKLVSDSSFSIRSTLRASHRKFHGRHENRNYTTSWGIVYFLRSQHDDIFKLILHNVSAGVKSDKAIEDHYVGGLAQLEKDLVKFYK
ncbi:MAG TPA: DUF1570 domain-containing protein, partial [Bacteroidia bacterium]|nr:DUF1570 domain-containing protein [Bacteroidia bacterium]